MTNKYTIDFVLSLKNTFNYDNGSDNCSDIVKCFESDGLKKFLLIYQKISDKIDFKRKRYKNQNIIKSNNSYRNKNKHPNKNKYKKNNNEWRLSNKNNNNNECFVKLKRGDNAWISHSLNTNNTDIRESNLVKYKKIIMGNLNKITDQNIDKIIALISNKLIDYNDILPLYLLAEELIKKIWFDNSFYEQYVKIIKHFSNLSEEWYSNLFLIYNNSDGDFYWKYIKYDDEYSKYTTNIKGSFQSQEDALDDALLKTNFKTLFLDICQREYNKKNDYINQIEDLIIQQKALSINDELEKDDIDLAIFKLKRKVVGTVEIIAYLLKDTDLKCSNDIFHIICVDILNNIIYGNGINSNSNHNGNTSNIMKETIGTIVKEVNNNECDLDLIKKNKHSKKKDILMVAFIKLWYIVCNHNSINKSNFSFRRINYNVISDKMTVIMYLKLLKLSINSNQWKSKIKFMLQDYIEFISKSFKLIEHQDIHHLNKLLQISNSNTNSNSDINIIETETQNEIVYEYDDDDFYNFKDLIATKISSYSKKVSNNNDKVDEYEKLYDYIDNLMPGDCSFMGDELYSKYIEELVLIIIMRCFDYNKEEDLLITGLLKRLIDDKLVNNKHILNTYKLIEEYWDDFIIDFPKIGEYMTSIKSRLALDI